MTAPGVGVRAVRAPAIDRGTVLADRYQVEALIGRGGSGEVFRAWDRVVETAVALKVLDVSLARDPVWIERVGRELKVARLIQHPNVCRIHEVDRTEDGRHFLTMELAPGGSLREVLGDAARPLSQRLSDARDAVHGLAALHESQIVHRDVKPENLLRMEDGRLALSDFGLAALPQMTVTRVVGTPSYMAPELSMGGPAGFRSDVWSLGVVLHEILFGSRPEWRQLDGGPILKRPDAARAGRVQRSMFRLVAACLSANPARRPADAAEVARLLSRGEHGSFSLLGSRRSRQVGWGILAAVIAVTIVALKERMWPRAVATLVGRPTPILSGEPADWTASSRVVASRDGRIHCLSPLADGNLRIVWGSPRVAEDIDPHTGATSPSSVQPETYQYGCPQVSPDGQRLLFNGRHRAGRAEIMYSPHPDGSAAVPVVSGFDPIWLPSGAEFAFSADDAHAGIFALPVMRMQLLDDSLPEGLYGIGMAVDPRGSFVVRAFADRKFDSAAGVIHEVPSRKQLASFQLGMPVWHPTVTADGHLLLWAREKGREVLIRLDWRSMTGVRLGTVPGADLGRADLLASGELAFVQQTIESDIHRVRADGSMERLTFDGNSYAPSLGPGGGILLQRRGVDSRVTIGYMPAPGRPVVTLTQGPLDGNPSFLPDGKRWVYSSFDRSAIMVCGLSPGSCRELHHDDLVPAWPTVSPNGAQIAYVTTNSARLRVVSLTGATAVRDLGPARPECPAFWSGPSRIWVLQGPDEGREWVEMDLARGPTGHRVPAPPATELDQGCQAPAELGAPAPVRELRSYRSQLRLVRP